MQVIYLLFVGACHFINKTQRYNTETHDNSFIEAMNTSLETTKQRLTGGYDERHVNETDPTPEKIHDDFVKMELLKKLQNNSISIYKKIILIDKYNKCYRDSKYAPNLSAGGLFKDWDHGGENW